MKIKLAILEKDKSYLNRIATAFGSKYADKFEIYSFTDQNTAMDHLDAARIDVLLASDCFDINVGLLPNRCGFAYLVDSADIDSLKDQRAICKFQKADLIYKQVLMVYSENVGRIGFKVDGDSGKIIAFTSVSGGVGASTMAAACALHFAARGSKVLYLNLEKYGSADLFFQGQGQFDMSDVIFALKSKKANLHIKLEGCVKQDPRGVHFFSQSKFALDMMELHTEEILRLLTELNMGSEYDFIILDMDFALDADTMKIFRESHAIVLVGNGTIESNLKTERAYTALTTLESGADVPLMSRMSFLYNKVSSKDGKTLNAPTLRVLGGAPVYTHSDDAQLLAQLQHMDAFDKIL